MPGLLVYRDVSPLQSSPELTCDMVYKRASRIATQKGGLLGERDGQLNRSHRLLRVLLFEPAPSLFSLLRRLAAAQLRLRDYEVHLDPVVSVVVTLLRVNLGYMVTVP